MARKKNPAPTYRLHQQTGRGRLLWTDAIGCRREKLLPGLFNSPESLAAKARLELEIAVSPTRGTTADGALSLAELLLLFWEWCQTYYTDSDGRQTQEVVVIKYALRHLRTLYGESLAVEFGPVKMKVVRQAMIDAGLCRTNINKRVSVIKRAFRWAASEELLPASVFQSLQTLPGLKKGRTAAKEAKPVGPVADDVVDKTLPHLPPHVRVMVQVMRWTGARPGEVCGLTLGQMDRASNDLWTYTPKKHKGAFKGIRRVVTFGPTAKAVLADFLAGVGRELAPDEPVFSPTRQRDERFSRMRANRKSRVQPSQVCRAKARAKKAPAATYRPAALTHAVALACERAFPAPGVLSKQPGESGAAYRARLTDQQKAELLEWKRAHRWHPYQLRHSYGTKARRTAGIEAARTLLGHSRVDMTEHYAEQDKELAAATAKLIG
jgi:integrase